MFGPLITGAVLSLLSDKSFLLYNARARIDDGVLSTANVPLTCHGVVS